MVTQDLDKEIKENHVLQWRNWWTILLLGMGCAFHVLFFLIELSRGDAGHPGVAFIGPVFMVGGMIGYAVILIKLQRRMKVLRSQKDARAIQQVKEDRSDDQQQSDQ